MRTLGKILLYLSVVIVPLLGASLWLDARGETATGTVSGKREEIVVQHEPTGSWFRRRYLEVAIPRLTALGLRASVAVDSADYERARRGDPVTVRYLACCPIFSRLATRSTRDVTRETVREGLDSPYLTWLVTTIVALMLAARIGMVVVLATGVASLAAAFVLLFAPLAEAVPTGVETEASVAGSTVVIRSPRVTRSGRRHSDFAREMRRLAVPYQVVSLRLVPAGAGDSVLAVDAIDADTSALLAVGSVVRVRYSPRHPGDARLVHGTRTFRERNRYHLLLPVCLVSGIGTAAGLAWRIRRRRRRAPA